MSCFCNQRNIIFKIVLEVSKAKSGGYFFSGELETF